MKRYNLRWLCGWLVVCLLLGVVSVGFAEGTDIELTNDIDMGKDIQTDDGDDIEIIQDGGIKNQAELLLDLEGGIAFDNLNVQLDIGFQDDTIASEDYNQMNAGDYTEYSNDTVFNVNGKNIKASDVGNQNNCWKYANAIYNKIWGVSFASDFFGSSSDGWNTLRNLSDNDRRLTTDNLKAFVSASQIGASIRITSCTSSCSQWNNDNLDCGHKGHSLVIVGKDSGGVTVVDNHKADNRNYSVNTRYYTWQGFVNYWGSYTYIKYIKWPNAPVYGSSQPVTASTLQFTNVTYPKTFRINTSAGWALGGGTVESNYDLRTLKSQILDSKGDVISSGTVSISGKSYAIRNMDTYSTSDNGVKFSYIKTEGNYKWVLTATDSKGRSLTLEMQFTAVTGGSTATSTASKKWTDESSAYLDLNGMIDGKTSSNLGNVGTVDVYIKGKRVANDVKDYWVKWPVGTSYEIKDIRVKSGYLYNGVYSGSLSGKVGSSTTEVVLRFDKKGTSAYLDLNGMIDGKTSSNLGDGGTVDVYIKGKRVADDVKDYWVKWPVGTSYEIKDIRAKSGYSYNGVYSGSLSGKVGSSTTEVVLRFDKNTQTTSTLRFTNVTYPKTFRINTSAGWALSGGTLESNYDLRTLTSQIINSNGNVVSSGSVSISGKSYAIRNLDTYSSTDNGVKFSYITSAGDYKWVLTATDSSGRSLTLTMPFTAVTSGSTVTSTASI